MTANQLVPLPNAINLRSLAGYPTADGRTIKPNKLFRSGDLSHLTHAEAEQLRDQYQVKTVIDLRSDDEVKRRPDQLADGMSYYQLPVFPFADHASFGQRLKRRFAKPEDPIAHIYKKMLTDSHALAAYRDMFDLLLSRTEDNRAILIHCTAGKDRTGVAAMMVEGALGVTEESMQADYLASNRALETKGLLQQKRLRSETHDLGSHPATNETFRIVQQLVNNSFGSWAEYFNQMIKFSSNSLITLSVNFVQ